MTMMVYRIACHPQAPASAPEVLNEMSILDVVDALDVVDYLVSQAESVRG